MGQAVVIPAYPPDERLDKLALSPTKNQGQPIRFLVSAPTMRIPCDVHKTVNAYLAFRAVLIAGISLLVLGFDLVSFTHNSSLEGATKLKLAPF